MRDDTSINIDLLPIGYAEIKITKDKITRSYSYKLILSNKYFKILLSNEASSEDEKFILCDELEADLFSQKRLKSYYNVVINHSYMEFEQYCPSIKKSLIIKLKPISQDILSITLVTFPNKKSHSPKNEVLPNYGKILDSTFDLMLILDSNLNLKFYNQEARRILGIENNTTELIEAMKYVHPEDQQQALDMLNTLDQDPTQEIRSEIRILNKEQDYIVMHFLAKNMLDVEEINGIVINAQDITLQKTTERKLIEKELYLESLFKAIPNLIFVLDYEGTFLDFKSHNDDKLAFTSNQFLGKRISALFPEYLSRKIISALHQLKEHKEVTPISYQYKNKSTEPGYYECHLSTINDEKVLAIVNDVTTLKKAEEELTQNQKLIKKKLDAIIAPQGKLSDLELADLVNIDELKDLFQTINDFTKIPVTLIDRNSNILFSIGMSTLCKEFHSVRSQSLDKCYRSNYSKTTMLKMGESKLYKCLNNVWNLVCPIYVGGEQIASLDLCQFRLADDTNNYEELLRHQANVFNFDKKAYIEAYYSLPVLDREALLKISSYYRDLLSKITALSYAQIKQARTANQLKLREEKLSQITDNMTDAFFIYDLDLNVTYISPSAKNLFGLAPEEYKLKTLKEKFPEASLKIMFDTLNRELATPYDENKNVIIEIQQYHANGNLIDLSLHAKLLYDDNKQPIGIIGSARDITQRNKAEAELNNQLQLQSLLSSIAMHYINIPIDQINDSISHSLKEFAQFANADRAYIFKYDWDKGTTSNTYEWCADGVNPRIDNIQDVPIAPLREWNKNQKAGKTISINNVQELSDDDETKTFLSKQNIKSVISVPLMNNDVCIGFVGFDSVEKIHYYSDSDITLLKIFAHLLVNISNRIALNKELSDERERATESDKLKSTLLRNIGHEFRTPLNGIIGLSELLQTKPIDPEYQKMANMILSSGIRLNYVLDSIMLLSQLESLTKTKFINLEQINLSNFLQMLAKQYQDQIEQKGLDLIIDIEPNLIVNINDNLFRQAMIHIINNAIKYTRKGSIKISCAQSSTKNSVEIIIEDTGIGIPKESQELIFKDFRQVSEGYNRSYEGCGLGLPIAKKAIELMQGKVVLESEFEHGSKFMVYLPFSLDNLETLENNNSNNKKSQKQINSEENTSSTTNKPLILIVEDNMVNQKLATSILSKYYETDSALDGETAIAMITQKQYDAILMDIHLGEGLDGLEVTKIIRDELRYKQTPIIAVTGYTMLGDKEHIMSQGCSHYLAKPYTKSQLLEIIEIALQ